MKWWKFSVFAAGALYVMTMILQLFIFRSAQTAGYAFWPLLLVLVVFLVVLSTRERKTPTGDEDTNHWC